MSFSFSLHSPKALPTLSPPNCRKFHFLITSKQKTISNTKFDKKIASISRRVNDCFDVKKTSLAIQVGALLAIPIIMNWLRIRWYRRKLLEMYLQFMCVFIFFPGLLLWAPFLNFRKFPRDPSMKYPWDTPEDPSQIKNAYLKYPWATPEDYD